MIAPRLAAAAACACACALALTAGAQTLRAAGIPAPLLDYRLPLAWARLDNGLQVVVSEDHSAPVVAVNVMFRAGVRAESKGRSGLAHFFEHLMFQGTVAMDKRDYARTINGVGGRYNGATRIDYANYYTAAPAHALDLLLWIEADRMRGLKLTPDVLENQRAVVLEEVKQAVEQAGPARPPGEVLQTLAFGKWANTHNGYGDLADLQSATLADMRQFYDRFYVPSNAVLVVVGDCDPQRVIARAREYFGPLPKTPPPKPGDVAESVPGREERSSVERVRGARAVTLAVGYRLPSRRSREFAAMSLLQTILGRDGRGRLQRVLLEGGRLAASVSVTFHDLGNDFDFDGPMLCTITVQGVPGRGADELLAGIDRVVSEVQAGIPDAEIADARLRHAMWFFDQVAGPGNPYAARARTIAAFALFDGAAGTVNEVLPGMARLTSRDLQSAARKFLAPSNRVWHARVPQ